MRNVDASFLKHPREPDYLMDYGNTLHPIWVDQLPTVAIETVASLAGAWNICKDGAITLQTVVVGEDGQVTFNGSSSGSARETPRSPRGDSPRRFQSSNSRLSDLSKSADASSITQKSSEGQLELELNTDLGKGEEFSDWHLDAATSNADLVVWVKNSDPQRMMIWTKLPFLAGLTFQSTTFTGHADFKGRELVMRPMKNVEKAKPVFPVEAWGHRFSFVAELSDKELCSKCNELWLFHGTSDGAAESITDDDFRINMAGSHRGTMFGPGIYLADSVTKSDEYTEENWKGLRTIIICRVVMGRALPQREGGRRCMQNCHQGGYHSVRGDRAYTEYVVYDEGQVYAEYLVRYRRIESS
jgi:hypothetical protein